MDVQRRDCLLGSSSNLAKVMWQKDRRECNNVTQHTKVPLYISKQCTSCKFSVSTSIDALLISSLLNVTVNSLHLVSTIFL